MDIGSIELNSETDRAEAREMVSAAGLGPGITTGAAVADIVIAD